MPEDLIEEAMSVLQGKSREVVIRELQRTVSPEISYFVWYWVLGVVIEWAWATEWAEFVWHCVFFLIVRGVHVSYHAYLYL